MSLAGSGIIARFVSPETVRGDPSLPLLVVEIGTHSLKFHQLDAETIRTVKYRYTLGHDVYSSGTISRPTMREVLFAIQQFRATRKILIATSAVRDAANRREFGQFLWNNLGLTVRVLPSWIETSLLASGYVAQSSQRPALVADIGGGSVELVFLNAMKAIFWTSLPLGAIRTYYGIDVKGLSKHEEDMEEAIRQSVVVTADEMYATGGTVKAVAKVLKKTTFSREDIERLEATVLLHGPPARLRPERAKVFYPGLLVMRKLLQHVQAERVHYLNISVGRVVLDSSPNARMRHSSRNNRTVVARERLDVFRG